MFRRKIISSKCTVFSGDLPFLLAQCETFIIHSKCFSGLIECSFVNANRNFFTGSPKRNLSLSFPKKKSTWHGEVVFENTNKTADNLSQNRNKIPFFKKIVVWTGRNPFCKHQPKTFSFKIIFFRKSSNEIFWLNISVWTSINQLWEHQSNSWKFLLKTRMFFF